MYTIYIVQHNFVKPKAEFSVYKPSFDVNILTILLKVLP